MRWINVCRTRTTTSNSNNNYEKWRLHLQLIHSVAVNKSHVMMSQSHFIRNDKEKLNRRFRCCVDFCGFFSIVYYLNSWKKDLISLWRTHGPRQTDTITTNCALHFSSRLCWHYRRRRSIGVYLVKYLVFTIYFFAPYYWQSRFIYYRWRYIQYCVQCTYSQSNIYFLLLLHHH